MIVLLVALVLTLVYVAWRVTRDMRERKQKERVIRKWGKAYEEGAMQPDTRKPWAGEKGGE